MIIRHCTPSSPMPEGSSGSWSHESFRDLERGDAEQVHRVCEDCGFEWSKPWPLVSRIALWGYLSSVTGLEAGMDLSGLAGLSAETWAGYRRLGWVTEDYCLTERGYRLFHAHLEAGV